MYMGLRHSPCVLLGCCAGVTVSFNPVLYTVTEGEESISLHVRMSGITLVDVNVTFRTVDNTAVGELSKGTNH